VDIHRYSKVRPYLYHLTASANVESIRISGQLFSATTLMRRGNRDDLVGVRRTEHKTVTIAGRAILIRDQIALHVKHADLPKGYTEQRLVTDIDGRVFFWPGRVQGPRDHGIRHFLHYKQENPRILRTKFESLLEANPDCVPRFCQYNSGSPRCSGGKKSPRNPHIFVTARDFSRYPSQVVEVTFDSAVSLPTDSEIAPVPTGPWELLF
jgi:hypothetical protein